MANFIHVVVYFVFSDRYFDLSLNVVIIKLHEEAIVDFPGCHDRMVVVPIQ
jgi:hypothetical protein